MNKQLLCVLAATFICNSANADLIGVNWQIGPYQHPDGLHITFQIYASFDDAGDQISAVNGLIGDGLNTLDFWTSDSSDIYNQDALAGTPFNDFPTYGLDLPPGEPWDSWITIGETEWPSNTFYTPDFLGDWGGEPPPVQVILGSEFHENDGAWFFFGAPPVVGDLPDAVDGNGTSDIVIAQFTVNTGVNIHLNGNVAWLNSAAGSNNTPFSVDTPAPGAIALLGFAGLFSAHRKRR